MAAPEKQRVWERDQQHGNWTIAEANPSEILKVRQVLETRTRAAPCQRPASSHEVLCRANMSVAAMDGMFISNMKKHALTLLVVGGQLLR